MTLEERRRLSKFLSYHLRHRPDLLGLELGPGGWVSIDDLTAAAARAGRPFSLDELREMVALNDKQRFAIDEEKGLIRANQGHSLAVDLELEVMRPPPQLYHGTATRFMGSISKLGLKKMSRHHVHLSADTETARKVGARHGVPVVLVVAAEKMAVAGYEFRRSPNGVWLVDEVPPLYLGPLKP